MKLYRVDVTYTVTTPGSNGEGQQEVTEIGFVDADNELLAAFEYGAEFSASEWDHLVSVTVAESTEEEHEAVHAHCHTETN